MELTDILSVEDWIQFEKELHDRFNLNCTVYNTSGIGITGNPNWCNRLCPKIKAGKESLAVICAAGNQNFMAQAKNTKKPVVGECDAGLLKIAVPIFIDGEFLGTAGGCGRPPEGGEIETFIIQKTTELDEDEINELCRDLDPMSEEQARQAAEFIEKRIAEYIAAYVGHASQPS
jgi:ligand-binding sensor protein